MTAPVRRTVVRGVRAEARDTTTFDDLLEPSISREPSLPPTWRLTPSGLYEIKGKAGRFLWNRDNGRITRMG